MCSSCAINMLLRLILMYMYVTLRLKLMDCALFPQEYRVYKIIDGSPAQRCGKIKIGDKILEVRTLFS